MAHNVLHLERGSRTWPDLLTRIDAPPDELWLRGRTEWLACEHKVAIVGTRAPTSYGEAQARRFARALAESGVVVVSGLARGIDARAIERLDVAVPTAYAAMLDREPPTASRLASIVNARYQLALAALRPALLDDVARDPAHWSAEIEDWAARVRIVAAPDLDSHYPERWPARVTAHAGSERHEILVLDSPGDPALAFGLPEIEDKAQRILGEGGRQTVHLALHACEDDAALARLRKEIGANP